MPAPGNFTCIAGRHVVYRVYWETLGECSGRGALPGPSPLPMNQFVERLPWRVAALAGLMVGAISLAFGADAWTSLWRVGAAFCAFAVLGLGLRAVLRQGQPPPTAATQGRHFDQTTPDDPSDEPAAPPKDPI